MPSWLVIPVVAVGLAVGAWLLHRAALRAEARGWIYYRSRPRGSASYAISNVDMLFRPEVEAVIEARDEEAVIAEVDESGEAQHP